MSRSTAGAWPTATTVDMHWPRPRTLCSRLRNREPGKHVERDHHRHADREVSPGQLGVDRIRDEDERGGEGHPGVQHSAELIRAGAKESHLVAADNTYRNHP